MMLPSRHYESEHTKFMRELLRRQPDLVRKQREGRAMWWDKTPRELAEERDMDQGRVAQVGRAVGSERGRDRLPERREAVVGHVREPEAEEDRVIALRRLPGEQVRLDVLDVIGRDAAAIDGDDFRRRVDRSDVRDARR